MDQCLTFIVARSSSKRLPFKLFLPFKENISIIEQIIIRSKIISNPCIILFDETSPGKNIIKFIASKHNCELFFGPENPSERIYEYINKKARKKYPNSKYFIRLTGDNPFISSKALKAIVKYISLENCDIDYLTFARLIPGTNPELFSFDIIEKIKKINSNKIGEHLTLYFKLNKNFGRKIYLNEPSCNENFMKKTLSIDTIEQYSSMLKLISDNDDLSTNNDSFINEINLTNYPHEKLNEKERYSELDEYRLS